MTMDRVHNIHSQHGFQQEPQPPPPLPLPSQPQHHHHANGSHSMQQAHNLYRNSLHHPLTNHQHIHTHHHHLPTTQLNAQQQQPLPSPLLLHRPIHPPPPPPPPLNQPQIHHHPSLIYHHDDQDQFTEEAIIQAILAAKEALEKPIEERDERDISLIDNLCSLVHGFGNFPKSVRRALAAQAVLIVIDEKGKELIVHNEELDSFCVLIFGECQQLNVTKTMPIRNYNVGDAFGVCEPTTDTIRFVGYMVTKCENCAFLCVKRDDFYTILTDPASNPFRIVLPDSHLIAKATEPCLLMALVDDYDRTDPEYVEDFLLLFRVFLTYDPRDRDRKLPPGMIKLCFTLVRWLDHVHFRDKVVKIVLTWLSSYYHDFELNSEFSYLFFRVLESRLLNLSMSNQLHLLHVTLSTKSKTRHVTISRSSREQPLTFSISGGYEKNCGIFVTQVHGSNSDDRPFENLISYINNQGHSTNDFGPRQRPVIPPRLRLSSTHNSSAPLFDSVPKISAQLRPGDQILEVNGTNFCAIKLVEAQKRLDMSTHLSLTVKYNPSAFHEMRALPEGRRKSSLSSLSSVSPHPSARQKFTFNLVENREHGPRNSSSDQYTPISPLFSSNVNFGFPSLIKSIPKNDRSRLSHLINSSKQFVKQIRDSTVQSNNVETMSKASDNASDDQSNDVDMTKSKSNPDLLTAKNRSRALESGISNIVRLDDLNPTSMIENSDEYSNQALVNVLRVFNAANNDFRYLLVHEETTAREVVMVAVKEFNLTGNSASQPSPGDKTISSLNWHLYEVSVVPESRTIKQKCLSEQTPRLAERASLCSRFYIKNNSQSSAGPSRLDMGDDSLVNEILKESPPHVTLSSLNATLLAVELTLADFDKFRSIEPQQFVYDTFFDSSEKAQQRQQQQQQQQHGSGSISSHDIDSLKSSSSDGQGSDTLQSLNKTRVVPKDWMNEYHQFADISNREMFWVICEILNEKNIGRRVKIVKQFVRVADVCSQLRNYNSMFAIISGLGHSCVIRLRRTFDKLKPKYKNQLEKMRSLFDPSKNMSNYRICLSQTQPPAIPLFPQIKKDLTFTKEGRSIFISTTTYNSFDSTRTTSASGGNGSDNFESVLINFAEIRQFAERVRNVIHFSSIPYSNNLLTNTNDNQRTQAQIKKMHEEWQMRKRIRHYINEKLNGAISDHQQYATTVGSSDKLDQPDGAVKQPNVADGKLSITYDEKTLYQRSLEIEPELNARPQQASASHEPAPPPPPPPLRHQPPALMMNMQPPPLLPTQSSTTMASNSSPTLSKSSSLSSCSSFSHHLPSYHAARGSANLTSSVGKFGTESTESLRKLQALSEGVSDWRSSSYNSNNNNNNDNNSSSNNHRFYHLNHHR